MVAHKPVIIGFGHRSRVGKDTAAKAIIKYRGGDIEIRRYSFAATLKREIEKLAKEYHGTEALCTLLKVPYDPNPPMDDPDCPSGKQRALLQFYGTDFWRRKDPNHWIDLLAKEIEYPGYPLPEVALITDVRFLNEAEYVIAHDGYMVRVERVGYVSEIPAHVSETGLEGYVFDYVLRAKNGDIEALEARAVEIFDTIMGRIH